MQEAVLLVDDEPHILSAYRRQLGKRFDIHTADSAEAAIEMIQKNSGYAVVVSDLKMPGRDGVSFLRWVKESYPDSGRILLTGHGDLSTVAEAVNEGGIHSYLTKPTPAEVLAESIEKQIHQHERWHSMRDALSNLNQMKVQTRSLQKRASRFDQTTGLLNRRAMTHALESWLEDLQAEDCCGTVVVADIDHFKKLNTEFGERAGDFVLSVTADRLAGMVDDLSIVGRWDSDAIAFTMNYGESSELVEMYLGRVAEILSEDISFEGDTIPVSVSIGAAHTDNDTPDVTTLLASAEHALNFAQKAKDQKICLSQNVISEDSDPIAAALRKDELTLCFQPQIDLSTGRVLGAEALLRRRDPVFGLQSPESLLRDARGHDSMAALDAWAIAEACKELAGETFPEEGFVLAVNVSASHFETPGFVELVQHALQETGVAPERLELEVTEDEQLSSSPLVIEAMHKLKALGVRLTIDDFGAAYATISNLINFPFDKMKIGSNFVLDAGADSKTDSILGWISILAQANGMTLVAEGIETEAQLKALQSLHYDVGQGFLFAAPLTAEAFASWLERTVDRHVPELADTAMN